MQRPGEGAGDSAGWTQGQGEVIGGEGTRDLGERGGEGGGGGKQGQGGVSTRRRRRGGEGERGGKGDARGG